MIKKGSNKAIRLLEPNIDFYEFFDFNKSIKELAFDVLLSRGFLVELIDDDIWLTDDALWHDEFDNMMFHGRSDYGFLESLLTKSNKIMQINNEFKSLININELNLDMIKSIYNSKIVHNSDSGHYVLKDWEHFTDGHKSVGLQGIKVPVESLEPFVALFVKACGLSGIKTIISCQGHHERFESHIQFIDTYSESLVKIVLELYKSKFELNLDWHFDNKKLDIKNIKNIDLTNYYSEIINVAKYILLNKDLILNVKTKATHKMKDVEIKSLDEFEIICKNNLFR